MDTDPIDELQVFLEDLESYAPTGAHEAPTRIANRSVGVEEIIDDSLQIEEPIELEEELEAEEQENNGTAILSEFQESANGPIATVDCGIVRLGETENGLVIALRATIVIDHENDTHISTLRTGPLYLHNHYKPEILHQIGRHLGNPELFVELDKTNPENPRPTKVKRGVADDSHQYGDRFRNWLERLAQRIVVTSIDNGIVLFDGALTLRTRDTPSLYLESLAELANERGNAVIAISKQSNLQIQGKPIRFWLNDVPNRPCYRLLSPLMRREGMARVLGNAYAVRFSPLGPTFRMDVKASEGQSDDEAIGQLFTSTLMRGGYPDILVRAHAYSYFTSPDVVQLQVQADSKYNLTPERDIDLKGIFAPFGGRFK